MSKKKTNDKIRILDNIKYILEKNNYEYKIVNKSGDISTILLPIQITDLKLHLIIVLYIFEEAGVIKIGFNCKMNVVDNNPEEIRNYLFNMNTELIYGTFIFNVLSEDIRFNLDFTVYNSVNFYEKHLFKYIVHCIKVYQELLKSNFIVNKNVSNEVNEK
jgi:hypothetical protein